MLSSFMGLTNVWCRMYIQCWKYVNLMLVDAKRTSPKISTFFLFLIFNYLAYNIYTWLIFIYCMPGLSCIKWDLVPWPGIESNPPCIGSMDQGRPSTLFLIKILSELWKKQGFLTQYGVFLRNPEQI